MKLISVVGARPQFIKEAVVRPALNAVGIEAVLINTGQHYDRQMSDVFFDVLGMPEADYNLSIGSGKHGDMTGRMMMALEPILEKESADGVLVYGDTNSTLAAALVAAKLKIPVAHVEAGIRMLPKDMPEEINRVIVDGIADLMFCPSRLAVDNLHKEGKQKGVFLTGDVMYDLYLKMSSKFSYEVFHQLGLQENNFVVVTLHRDYNVDDEATLTAVIKQLAKVNEQKTVVFPLHPRTKKNIEKFGLQKAATVLRLIEPIDYLNLMGLTQKAWKVITDSGGYQKESYFADKIAVVLMPDTGWKELVEGGFNVLCSPFDFYDALFNEKVVASGDKEIYGSGNAGEKIADLLKNEWSR